MAPLKKKYLAEIRAWNWAGIVEDAKNNVGDMGMFDDEPHGACYLGSVLSLAPSGKYYTPFANSNVDVCPQCGGSGVMKNRKANPEAYADAKKADSVLRTYAMEHYGGWAERRWPDELVGQLDALVKTQNATKPELTCSRCGGMGSHEAYQDQEFYDALDQVAEEHGGWIESGEGDALDIFFGIAVEVPEEDAEEEVGDA